MSTTPAVTVVEVSRALNALATTLNEQRAREVDRERWRQIVSGALGGEDRLLVDADPSAREPTGLLKDRDGRVVGSVRLEGGRWIAWRSVS